MHFWQLVKDDFGLMRITFFERWWSAGFLTNSYGPTQLAAESMNRSRWWRR